MRGASDGDLQALRSEGVRALMSVPINRDGKTIGHFRCASRTRRAPNFELHAAAELFAQMFAMRVTIDELTAR